MANTKNCTYCGQKLEKSARFCMLCGKQQEQPTVQQKSNAAPLEESKAESAKKTTEELGNKAADAAKAAFGGLSQKVKDAQLVDKAKEAVQDTIETAKPHGKKKKTKVSLFEEDVITGEDAAREIIARNNQKIARCRIGLVCALLATLCSVTVIKFGSVIPDFLGMFVLGIWGVGLIVGYLATGGILHAIKLVWRLATIGWFIAPTWATALFLAGIGGYLGVLAFFICPVVFVGISYIQVKKELEQAELYCGIVRK